MKKALLFLFAIILSNLAFSQYFNKVVKCSILQYQYEDWTETQENYPNDMYVIIDKQTIKITNQAEAKYKTYGNPKSKKIGNMQTMTWDAYDKNGKSCLFIMKSFDDSEMIVCTILYNGYGLQYITKPEN